MSTQTTVIANPYLRFLLIGGIALVGLGAVLGLAGKNNGDHEAFIAELGGSLQGGLYDDSAAQAAYAMGWVGLALAILGVVLLVAWLAIRAARH